MIPPHPLAWPEGLPRNTSKANATFNMCGLPIPSEALEDAGILLGRRGAGKSNALMCLFEHELDAGHRAVMIDPKGDRWGIRMAPDGSPSRFDIPVFGGEHGDIPLDQDMGERMGRLVAVHDLSCLIDLSHMSLAGKQRFMMGFAPELLQHNRAALTLFIEEVDQFANQDPRYQPAMLVHHIANFATLGRQRGIVPWVASQRPAKVNATVRSQADTFVGMRVTNPLDREAFREWFKGHSKDAAARVENEIGALAPGEALVWIGATQFFDRIRFPMATTFDSGRTPRHGETISAVTLPPIDLTAIAAALAGDAPLPIDDAIPADAAAAYAKGSAIGVEIQRRDDLIALLKKQVTELQLATSKLKIDVHALTGERDQLLARVAAVKAALGDPIDTSQSLAKIGVEAAATMDPAAVDPVSRTAPETSGAVGDVGGDREYRALTGLTAIYPAGLSEAAWAARTGYSRKGGAWIRRRKRYLDANLVEQRDGRWFATEAGIAQAGEDIPDMPQPGPELIRWWAGRIGAAGRLLTLLQYAAPRGLTRDGLAAEAGMASKGGAFIRHVTALKRAELAEERGKRLFLSPALIGEAS